MQFNELLLKMIEYIDNMSDEELHKAISDIFDKEEIHTPFGTLILYKRKSLQE